MNPAPENSAPLSRNLFRTMVGSNLIGAALCTFYFIFLDQVELPENPGQDLYVSLAMTLGLIGLGSFLSRRWEKGILQSEKILSRGETPGPELLAKAQPKVLQAPFFFTGVAMINWLIAACIMALYVFLGRGLGQGYNPLMEAGRVFLGVLVSGVATAALVYFISDNQMRKLRPLFFPRGGLLEVRGVFRFGVRARLVFAFLLVSILPMTVVAVLSYQKAVSLALEDPASLPASLLTLLIFILAAGIPVSLVMARLVSSSISQPMGEIQAAMRKVRGGDLSAGAPVTSNDELGSLAESYNLMVAGLREKDRVKDLFGRFVTPQIAEAIMAHSPALGGENTEVTILFADIRSYTTICESLSPTQVIEFLNNYFSHMVKAIEMHRGIVNQFVGDGIMAVFGAPVKQKDHASKALAAAREMLAELSRFNQLYRQGQSPIGIGIGINTGPVVAGIIGTQQRMEYRVVGDAVNLASRVEGLNKKFNTSLLISSFTKNALPKATPLKPLGPVQVKGKKQIVEVFEPL